MTTKKDTPQKRGASTPQPDPELIALAHHIAEALRIARLHPDVPSSLYNGLGEAWTDYENSYASHADCTETEERILSSLVYGTRGKGGAK